MAKSRRSRTERTLQRRPPKDLGTGDIILIVCEGEKTEPSYFKGLRNEWRLHPTQIEIIGEECDSAPISVVDYALELRRERERNAKRGMERPYDQIWCVFDYDEHEDLSKALDKACANSVKIALSTPCFEFWYLLHFLYTTRGFRDPSQVINMLKQHIRDYDKSLAPLGVLLAKLDNAMENALKLRKHNEDTDSKCPATDVDLLVTELRLIRPGQRNDG